MTTLVNCYEEFAAKCELIRSLPFDPAGLWRNLVMDFQFFPQPLSKLSALMQEQGLRRLSAHEWAQNAM